MDSMIGGQEQASGRDHTNETDENGLRTHNRSDLPFTAFEDGRRSGRWQEGDLFAVFRTGLGEMRVQHGVFADYAEYACSSVARIDLERRKIVLTQRDINFLVGMIMISRIHDYEFEDFLHLLDHNGSQLFDMRDLCNWISMNSTTIFLSEIDEAMEYDAYDEEGLISSAEEFADELTYRVEG